MPSLLSRSGTRLCLVAASLVLAGCSTQAPAAPRDQSIRVEQPTMPSASDCGGDSTAGGEAAQVNTPAAGRYSYRTTGTITSTKDGEKSGKKTDLPASSAVVITDARKIGTVRCFRVQRRLTDSIADTATMVIRGPDVYLTTLEVQVGGELTTSRPNPPIRSLNSDELEWSGTFAGTLKGNYAAKILGRKAITVAGKKFKAVGVEVRTSFVGDVSGTERTVTWFSLEDNLPLAEEVDRQRDFGLEEQRVEYRSELSSLEPRR